MGTRRRVDAAEAPQRAGSVTGAEKEPYMTSADQGVGDAPAAGVPAAAEDVVISAPVHCHGCARKLRRSLQRLAGVGDVSVDSRKNTVVLSGPGVVGSATEAVKIVERKTGRKATPLNPSPAVKGSQMKKNDAGVDIGDQIEVVDTDMAIVLRINLHCEACCEEIKRRILKIEGVKEAAPLLKSSQIMVKGMVEPATLVGFIHRSTGRKAAIIRAEPLNLQPITKSSPIDAPPVAAEKKHEDPSVNLGEKKGGHEREVKEAPREENRGEGDNHANVNKLPTEKPSGNHDVEGHETHHDDESQKDGGDGFVLENHKKEDHLFRDSLPTGVVTVAPEIALNNLSPYYPPYPYEHQHHFYQYPPSYPYAYGSAMYGYPHYPPGAFSEENPNACTIL